MTPAVAILGRGAVAAAQSPPAEVVLFYAFAGLTAASALAVVLSRNVLRMSVALMFALGGVAGLFVLLQAEFLAAVQLVVYVGGTLILIVFGVMLTSKSPFSRLDPTGGEVALAGGLAAVLLATLAVALLRPDQRASAALAAAAAPAFLRDGGDVADGVRYEPGPQRLTTDRRLVPEAKAQLLARAASDGRRPAGPDRRAFAAALDGLSVASRGLPVKQPMDPNAAYPMAGLGVALLGDYLLPFELASVLLLAVMIGAAFLAKARPKDGTAAGKTSAAASDTLRARQWS